SAVLITKTLLFAGDTGDAVMGGFGIDGPAKFRAFDKKTGKVLGAVSIPAGLTSGPMTYEVDGKQVIVFAIGSRSHAPEWVALALK
ncbi:MAG: pyrroloquinoline quinone-dependent dehydrogenase, partial [Alphaproteobacteria bacterium]|nr:pyrroloquinoline quinone-dependent dehydrogenase [Alphaproteobacteria bacterium]